MDGHPHGHGHGESQIARDGASRRRLASVLLLTGAFALVEVAVGFWSGSLALLADAGHMLGDSGALAVALVVAVIAARPPDDTRTYGYRRAEVLGALFNGALLLIIVALIASEAFGRLWDPPPLRAEGLLLTAAGGLVVNLVAALVLFRSAKHSINVRAALYHVFGDALGSVAAIVAGAFALAGLPLADPIASLIIAGLIMVGAVRLLREASHVLMEGAPTEVDVDAVRRTIAATLGVAEVHDLHVWSLSPGHPVVSAHVVLEVGHHGVEVSRRVATNLEAHHGLHHVTIQPEAPPADLVQLRRTGE